MILQEEVCPWCSADIRVSLGVRGCPSCGNPIRVYPDDSLVLTRLLAGLLDALWGKLAKRG